jgi:ATP-dependent Clp protease ATP-binding subunit ClpC
MAERELSLNLSDDAKELLVDKGWDPAMGARPLRRAIQRYIEDPLADQMLRSPLEPGSTVEIERKHADGAGDGKAADSEDDDVEISVTKPKKKKREAVGVGAGSKGGPGEGGGELPEGSGDSDGDGGSGDGGGDLPDDPEVLPDVPDAPPESSGDGESKS